MALPVVRFSHLRAYGRSPMHGQLARQQDQEQTYAMERGTALHALLFGTRKVVGYPGAQRRGKDYDAFVADHPDTDILTMADFDKAQRMADAVRASDLAMKYLDGVFEETLLFPWMGMDCRATPDVRGKKFVTELKSSSTSDPQRFHWQALRMHYHAQMMMQLLACDYWKGSKVDEAYEEVVGDISDAYIVCVESAAPFPVTVFKWTTRALDAGYKLLTLWAERLKNCELSRQYPPYSQSVVEIDIPDEEVELTFGDAAEEIAA